MTATPSRPPAPAAASTTAASAEAGGARRRGMGPAGDEEQRAPLLGGPPGDAPPQPAARAGDEDRPAREPEVHVAPLLDRRPTVDRQRVADDERRGVTAQPDHRARDLLGLGEALQRGDAGERRLETGLATDVLLGQRGAGRTRAHAVDPDPLL